MTNSLIVLWNWDFLVLYFKWIFNRIPSELLLLHILIVLISIVIVQIVTNDLNKRRIICSLLLLIGYLSIVLMSTVILRETYDDYRYELIPFWSYFAYIHKDSQLLTQIYLNILLFVPIGLLLRVILHHKKMCKVLPCGIAISTLIETCQLLFKKGVFEFDDMFHNTIGCIIGFLFVELVLKLNKSIKILCQYLKTKPC